jgi:nucleotide-binding universal stress UspA family protein
MADPIVLLSDPQANPTAVQRYVAALAPVLNAQILLLPLTSDVLTPALSVAAEMENTTRSLAQLAQALPGQTALVTTENVLPSQTAPVLRRHHPQLLVLNRPEGADGVEMTRDRAADLLSTTAYPLLVVPAETPAVVPRRIAIAVDGGEFNIGEAAAMVRQLLRTDDVVLTVLHVTQPASPLHGYDAIATVESAGLVPFPVKPGLLGWINRVPADGVLDAVAASGAELLLAVARRRSFWGNLLHTSVTADVLGRSPIPVLVLPTVAAE